MVEILIIYGIFALTTSLAAYINLIRPVLSRIKYEQPLNDLAQSPKISIVVFIIIGFLIAPIIFLPSIIPKYALTFQDALFETVME